MKQADINSTPHNRNSTRNGIGIGANSLPLESCRHRDNGRRNHDNGNRHRTGVSSIKLELLNSTEFTFRYPNRTEKYVLLDTKRMRPARIELVLWRGPKRENALTLKSQQQIRRFLKDHANDYEIEYKNGRREYTCTDMSTGREEIRVEG